jgi:hypothetical protein
VRGDSCAHLHHYFRDPLGIAAAVAHMYDMDSLTLGAQRFGVGAVPLPIAATARLAGDLRQLATVRSCTAYGTTNDITLE